MKFGVVIFPGSNCDQDTFFALSDLLGQETVYLWHKEKDLRKVDVVVLPGGFSFGDYLRCGAIAKFSPIMSAVERHAAKGRPVLGICNGFQILLESHLLPGVLLPNAGLRFICKEVCVRVENNQTTFTNRFEQGQVIRLPIAHHGGAYFLPQKELSELESRGQILFRYSTPEGTLEKTSNPNGSLHSIAGICNAEGNVMGMMPHPERSSEALLGSTDGLLVFQSIVTAFEKVQC